MMRSIAGVSCAVVFLALCASSVAGAAAAAANAASDTTGKSAKEAVAKPDQDLEPFPAAKSIHQAAVIAGKRLDYVVTVGSVTLKDRRGQNDRRSRLHSLHRPRRHASGTFSFNGGPGAASVYLNLGGAADLKKIEFGRDGDTASGSASLHDNPNSWLEFTDLVFVDPIGTGFSRSRVDEEQTKKNFLTAEADIHYLSEVVYGLAHTEQPDDEPQVSDR